jgi:hypothetical protein
MDPTENDASPGSDAAETTSEARADTDNRRSRQQRTPIADLVDPFLHDKDKGDAGESGNYRSDASHKLDRFVVAPGESHTQSVISPRVSRLDSRSAISRGVSSLSSRRIGLSRCLTDNKGSIQSATALIESMMFSSVGAARYGSILS